MMVSTVVKAFREVRRWQVRQTDGPVRVLVVPSPDWHEAAGSRDRRKLAEKFGRDLRFEVDAVDDIPLAPTGKFQTIVPLELLDPTTSGGAGYFFTSAWIRAAITSRSRWLRVITSTVSSPAMVPMTSAHPA